MVQDTPTASTPWMTPAEAAQYLRMSLPALYGQCRYGNLKYRRVGRRMLFRREWLDEPSAGSRKKTARSAKQEGSGA